MEIQKLDLSKHDQPAGKAKGKPELLRVMTQNIWDEQHYFQERIHAIIRIIKNRTPDIICLLDVSQTAYGILEKGLGNMYIMFEVFTREGDPSGTVMFCNKNTIVIPDDSQPYYYDYPQGGRIIGAEVKHIETDYSFHVLATRLDELPDNDNIREAQCEVIYGVVKKIDNYILMGDVNFYSRCEKAEVRLNSIMIDTWIKIQCPPELRFTYNGATNPIIRNNARIRNGRIYYRSKKDRLLPRAMSIVGLENISDEIKIPPSPYYGLEAVYDIKRRT
jgi:hypothetical protein